MNYSNSIKVSVLMAVYNEKLDYLKQAVSSILSQDYDNIEFIIVNDGSDKADINNLLDELSLNPKIIYKKNSENIGLTKSLNLGLRLCTGKYIARMDSDDISDCKRLTKQIGFMENNPEVAVLGSDVYYILEDETRIPPYVNYASKKKSYPIKILFNNVGPIHPTYVIRKEFISKNNITYREELVKSQDYGLLVDCLDAGGQVYSLEEKLLGYRVHKNQITIGQSKQQLEFKKRVIKERLIALFDIDKITAEVLSTLYDDDYDYSPDTYIKSLIEIKEKNKMLNRYDVREFEIELRTRWIHKVNKCMIKKARMDGFLKIFTYKCLFSFAFPLWIKNTIFHKI